MTHETEISPARISNYGGDVSDFRSRVTAAEGSNAITDRTSDVLEDLGLTQFQMLEEEALEYVHHLYEENLPKWLKYADCYQSSDIYKYIQKHPRESFTMWEKRVQRGYYYNYCASVIDMYISHLFHAAIVRQHPGQDDIYLDFHANADLAGTTFHKFMRKAGTFAQISGHVGILVDAPKLPPEGFRNEKERKDAKHRPYVTMIHAHQIKDWEVDQFGNFIWVKLEVKRPQDRSWTDSEDDETRTFVIWTKDSWEEWELNHDEATIVDSGIHTLGKVPLVILKNEDCPRDDTEWFGLSTIRDIADINIAILNWSSIGDEEIYERCLNVLTMEKAENDAPVEMSHHNVLEYAPGAAPPQYLTPGTTPLDLVGSWIERAKDEIYRLAKFGGTVGLVGVRQATSGIAYAFEFNETNQALAQKAENLEDAERQVMELVANWNGKSFEGSIEYPREFGVEDFMVEFAMLTEARTTLTSEKAIKALEKKIAAKLFSKDTAELREEILKEIENAQPQSSGFFEEGFGNLPPGLLGTPGPDEEGGGVPVPAKSRDTGKPGGDE